MKYTIFNSVSLKKFSMWPIFYYIIKYDPLSFYKSPFFNFVIPF